MNPKWFRLAIVAGMLSLGLTGSAQATKCTYVGGNGSPSDCVQNVISTGSPSFATAQAPVSATAAQVVAARLGRNAVTVENLGTTAVYLGGPSVTATTGFLLPGVVGASVTIPTQAALSAITATGTATVSILESY